MMSSKEARHKLLNVSYCLEAPRYVLLSNAAIVIGPAPPGTEVIAPATCDTSSAATSPTTLKIP